MPIMQSIETTLIDVDPVHWSELPIRVSLSPLGLTLYAEGHGDHGSSAGHGSPLFIELRQGRLRLIVWANINQVDPTHVIDLDGAREDRRQPDGN